MKIAALYARVSTQKQEKEETIESQIAEIRTRIELDGYVLPSEHVFVDDGWSGELLDRPELDRLRDAIRGKGFEALYVYDLGRLSRNFLNQLILIEEIKKAEVKLVSLHDINAENEEQLFARNVMGLFHDFERKKIAERFRRGKLYKARMGKYMNLQAPYGYNYVPKTNEKDPYLIINEEEAEIVRKIFHWVADEKLTTRGVIKRLYELGIPPRKRKRITWTHGPVFRLLRNEDYIGRAYYNKNYAVVPVNPKNNSHYRKVLKSSRKRRPKEEWIESKVPKIIDESLFLKVQERLILNQKFNRRNRKTKCLLPQKVFCICGRHRNIEGVREHRYYRCTDRIYMDPLPRKCFASGVDAFHLDDLVWRNVLGLFTNEDLVMRQARRWMDNKTQEGAYSKVDMEGDKKLLRKLEDEEDRYVKAYGAGLLSLDQFKERQNEVKERKQKLELSIASKSDVVVTPVIDLSSISSLTERFGDVLKSLTFEEKQLFLRDVLDKVVVGDGAKVLVKGCIPISNQIESEVQNNGLWPLCRDSWVAECRKVDAV